VAPFTKGVILGFGDVHTRAHVYRAILEGLIFALKEGAQLTRRRTGPDHRDPGDGRRRPRRRDRADDSRHLRPAGLRAGTPETSILGAAMDAAVGMKLYPDIAAALREWLGTEISSGRTWRRKGPIGTVRARVPQDLRSAAAVNREIQRITGYPPL